MSRKLDYSEAWADTKALLRSQRDGVAAIAGALWFFPARLSSFLTRDVEQVRVQTLAEAVEALRALFAASWYITLPTMLIGLWGTVALYALLTRRDLPHVGDALRLAAALIPVYFITQLLAALAIWLGFMLFILPGFYVIARLVPLAAVVVAEPKRGVIGSLKRAWELTDAQGWRIALLFFVVILVTMITYFVASLMIELPVALVVGRGGVPLLSSAIEAAGNTVINLISLGLTTAIYKQLTSPMKAGQTA
jgi:hypothetical protein